MVTLEGGISLDFEVIATLHRTSACTVPERTAAHQLSYERLHLEGTRLHALHTVVLD